MLLAGAQSGSGLVVSVAVILGIILVTATWFFTEPSHDAATNTASGEPETRSAAQAHVSPRPQGEDYEPWQPAERMRPTAGEFYRQSAYARLAEKLGLPADGSRATVDLAVDLALDRGNPHARHDAAVSIWAEGQHVAFLPDDAVPDYLGILERLEGEEKHLTLRARLYVHYDSGKRKWRPSLMIRLPNPEQILPPATMPPGAVELIPTGRTIQVIGEENHMDYLSTVVDPEGPLDVVATLSTTRMGTRTFYDTVQVIIDGHKVGTFSKAMGEQTVPLVKLIESAGKVPVARATIEGNALRAEVKVRMLRAAELDHERVRELQQLSRERNANTNLRGEAFDWDDQDLSTERAATRGREARQQQDQDAESGGA